MPYQVEITLSAQRQLSKLPDTIAERIEEKLLDLENNPRPIGCKKLKGRLAYRIRIGDYRAIYTVNDNVLTVIVIKIGHRRDVYE